MKHGAALSVIKNQSYLSKILKQSALSVGVSMAVAFTTVCFAGQPISDDDLRAVIGSNTSSTSKGVRSKQSLEESDAKMAALAKAGYSESSSSEVVYQLNFDASAKAIEAKIMHPMALNEKLLTDNQDAARYQFAIISLGDIGLERYSYRWSDNYQDVFDLTTNTRDLINFKLNDSEFYQVGDNLYNAHSTIYGNDVEVVGIHGIPVFEVTYHDQNGRAVNSTFAEGVNRVFK